MTCNKDNDFNTESMGEGGSQIRPIPKIEQLGLFKIEKELSSGGGGTVYLAFDESMKRRVALKVLHPSLGISGAAQTRFAREAWIAGQLEHSNIIKVYSRGEENHLNYIAMEFAESGSLSDFIKQLRAEASKSKDIRATANKEHIRSIVSKFVELANALEYIHSKGFIHRDIKPHNILLAGESKQFKLTDFGIAHAADMTKMTKAGDFMGTIHYMSPEQITAHRTTVDKRTDIYSLGVSIYEALTLSLPFEADSEEQLIGEIISGHYIPARKRIRSIPKDLETVLMKATHHDASRRYQTAKEFADDLQRFLEDKPIVARPDSIFYKSGKALSLRKRVNQAALIVIILIAAAGVVLTKVQQDRYDKEKILTTLRRTVESESSPFEFEPDWDRLQHKLYEHIKRGTLDSTMIWFFKTVANTDYIYQKYTLNKNATINVTITGFDLFDDEFIDLNDYFIHRSTLKSVENRKETTKGYFYYRYNVKQPGAGFVFSIPVLKDSGSGQLGKVRIPVQVTTEHYLNSTFYRKINEEGAPDYIENLEIVGDTLLKLPFRSIATRNESYFAIDNGTFDFSKPYFTYETIDTLELFVFDQWPDNFPKAIPSSNLENDTIQNFRIRKIEFIRMDSSKYLHRIEMIQNLNIDFPPFAFKYELKNNSNGVTFLTGTIVANELKTFDITFEEFKLNAKFWNWWSSSDEGFITERVWTALGVSAEDSVTFRRLQKFGEVDGTLSLIPSIELARATGEMSEFWGDTLFFEITFRAIDSSNTD